MLERSIGLDATYAPAWTVLAQRYYYDASYSDGGKAALERSRSIACPRIHAHSWTRPSFHCAQHRRRAPARAEQRDMFAFPRFADELPRRGVEPGNVRVVPNQRAVDRDPEGIDGAYGTSRRRAPVARREDVFLVGDRDVPGASGPAQIVDRIIQGASRNVQRHVRDIDARGPKGGVLQKRGEGVTDRMPEQHETFGVGHGFTASRTSVRR